MLSRDTLWTYLKSLEFFPFIDKHAWFAQRNMHLKEQQTYWIGTHAVQFFYHSYSLIHYPSLSLLVSIWKKNPERWHRVCSSGVNTQDSVWLASQNRLPLVAFLLGLDELHWCNHHGNKHYRLAPWWNSGVIKHRMWLPSMSRRLFADF